MPKKREVLPTVILIPAYKPDENLVTLCRSLCAQQLPVVVVDDGGGQEYLHLFEAVQNLGVLVARHAVNLGKGRALKTGINVIMQRWPKLQGVVTADADGQHTPEDILRIVAAMEETPGALVTGARAFTGNVPFRSRAGNAITRWVYRFVAGIPCYDTQTGLRGLPASALPAMLRLSGERYEYEMSMLLGLRDMNLTLREVPIETIYIDDNKGSHFNPLRDAIRIYSVIFRFIGSSIFSFCVEYLLYLAMLALSQIPWLSYALSRLLSGGVNFAINRTAVFGGRGGKWAALRYGLLALVQMTLGASLVQWMSSQWGWDAKILKIPVDVVLFFVSYVLQREFVFSSRFDKKTHAA